MCLCHKRFLITIFGQGSHRCTKLLFFCVCLVVLLFQLLRALNASGAVKESKRVKWLEEWRGAGRMKRQRKGEAEVGGDARVFGDGLPPKGRLIYNTHTYVYTVAQCSRYAHKHTHTQTQRDRDAYAVYSQQLLCHNTNTNTPTPAHTHTDRDRGRGSSRRSAHLFAGRSHVT